jgi:hypothetical protein
MALTHNNFTVTTASQQVSPTTGATNSYTLVIQNNHASNIVYVGSASTVSSSSYGVSLSTGASVSLDDLRLSDTVWVIASAASTPVSVLTILR